MLLFKSAISDNGDGLRTMNNSGAANIKTRRDEGATSLEAIVPAICPSQRGKWTRIERDIR